jgi:hypothetical protein
MARKKTAKKPAEVTETAPSEESSAVQPADATELPEPPSREATAMSFSPGEAREIAEADQLKPEGHAAALGRSGSARSESGLPEYVGGPRPTMTISLSDYSGGPVMHLQRSLRFNQIQIRFEHGQPDEQYLARLKQAGWSDRTQSEGVWTKQIDREARWQSVAQIEQEFSSLANDIRKDRGLSPVWQGLALA